MTQNLRQPEENEAGFGGAGFAGAVAADCREQLLGLVDRQDEGGQFGAFRQAPRGDRAEVGQPTEETVATRLQIDAQRGARDRKSGVSVRRLQPVEQPLVAPHRRFARPEDRQRQETAVVAGKPRQEAGAKEEDLPDPEAPRRTTMHRPPRSRRSARWSRARTKSASRPKKTPASGTSTGFKPRYGRRGVVPSASCAKPGPARGSSPFEAGQPSLGEPEPQALEPPCEKRTSVGA